MRDSSGCCGIGLVSSYFPHLVNLYYPYLSWRKWRQMIARNVVCLPRRNHRNWLPVVSVVCRRFCPSSNISHQFRLPLCFYGACMKWRSLTKNSEARFFGVFFNLFFYCVPAEALYGVNNRETNEKHDIWKIIIALVIKKNLTRMLLRFLYNFEHHYHLFALSVDVVVGAFCWCWWCWRWWSFSIELSNKINGDFNHINKQKELISPRKTSHKQQ